MRVFVTGATGLIGKQLCAALLARGDEVVALSRRPRSQGEGGIRWVQGDPSEAGAWTAELEAVDAVVHLAGEPIASGRWTQARKRRLVASRVDSTKRIVTTLAESRSRPTALLCGSATGYYGPRGDELLDETAPPGRDFLATLCADWEAAAKQAEQHDIRVVSIRLGVVLSAAAGALKQMLLPFRLGLGGPLGPAGNWFPWIHHQDVTDLLCFTLDREIRGAVNFVAPGTATMGDFARELGSALKRPALIPLPTPLLGLLLGEMSEALAPGQRVVPRVALETGYGFRHPDLGDALRACLRRA